TRAARRGGGLQRRGTPPSRRRRAARRRRYRGEGGSPLRSALDALPRRDGHVARELLGVQFTGRRRPAGDGSSWAVLSALDGPRAPEPVRVAPLRPDRDVHAV